MQRSHRFWLLSVLVFFAAMSRWVPHAPNFTPIMAMALFSGTFFRRWEYALAVPFLGLLISDFGLGFHDQMIPVYISFGLAVGIGHWIGSQGDAVKTLAKRLPFGIVSSSLVFFLVSNFFVWAFAGMYPLTSEGFFQCYIMAIPFLHNELLGNLVFSSALFGSLYAVRFLAPQLWGRCEQGRWPA